MITVEKDKRFGYTKGCWWISRQQAGVVCGKCNVSMPSLGMDRSLIDNDFDTYLSNLGGHYRLHDERDRLNIKEK